MSKCKHCSSDIIKEIEKKYKLKIFEIKFCSNMCGTSVHQKVNVKKGIGFKAWSKKYFKTKE